MSRRSRKRRGAAVAVVAVLASLGGLDIMLVTSSGSGRAPELARAVADQGGTPAASSQSPGSPAGSHAGSAPGATAPAAPKVVEKPPPVVDGVRRVNVRSAHSPRLLHQLAAAPSTMPPASDAGGLGVDVADYQHPQGAAINWSQVAAAGYKFAFIKVTEGDYYVNPYFAYDLAQAKAAGLYATGYAFAVPNVSGGASQADSAVANGGHSPGGHTLPLALDIEYNPYGSECYGLSPAQMVSWVSAFAAETQRVTGQPPIIYSTADWWNTCTGGATGFGSDPLWVAAYGSSSPPLPAGWGSWTFWQYTSQGSAPGISGNVDVSYFLHQASLSTLDSGSQQNAVGTVPSGQPSPSASRPAPQSPSASRAPSPPVYVLPPSHPASPPVTPPPSSSASAPPPSTGSPSPSGSPSLSPSGSPSPSASACPTATPTPTTSPSPSPSVTPSPCASPTATVPASPSPSPAASK